MKEKLERIAQDEDLMMEFVINLNDQIASDDEPYDDKFRHLKDAYEQHPDIVDDVLMTICGWRMETLVNHVLNVCDD